MLLADATVTYDLDVVSGSVTGGLVAADGAFQSNTPTHGPTDGWIQVTDHMLPGLLSGVVAFETLTPGITTGGDYYVDNINVTGNLVVPEPATMTCWPAGLADFSYADAGPRRPPRLSWTDQEGKHPETAAAESKRAKREASLFQPRCAQPPNIDRAVRRLDDRMKPLDPLDR